MPIDPLELLNELPDLVCFFTPDGTLQYVNETYADYYATTPDAMIGTSFLDLVPAAHRGGVAANLARLRELRPGNDTFIDVHLGGDAWGNARWMRWTNKARFAEPSIDPVGFIGIGRDITDQKKTQDQVRYLATHDSLTGVLNRHTVRERLTDLIEQADQHQRTFGLLYLDLDGLKAVNDGHGHSAGDELLQLAACQLLSAFRACDVVARMGGDEFVVLCPDVEDESVLAAMLERAREGLDTQWQRFECPAPIGVSAGYALYTGTATADEVLQIADAAMYRDKKARKSAAVNAKTERPPS